MFLRAHLSASVVGLIFHITNELTVNLYKQNGYESSTKNVHFGGIRLVRTVKRITTNNQPASVPYDLTYHALPHISHHRKLTCIIFAAISRTMPFHTYHNTGNSPVSVPPRSHVPCPSVQITSPGTHLLQFRHDLTHHALP